MTEEQLQAIKERAEKATQGPWEYSKSDSLVTSKDDLDGELFQIHHGAIVMHEDGEFIAQAREDVPTLIAEVERLQQQIFDERRAHLIKVYEVIGEADKKLVEENERLREALEFYAKESTYWYTESSLGKLLMDSKINGDLGEKARQALRGDSNE